MDIPFEVVLFYKVLCHENTGEDLEIALESINFLNKIKPNFPPFWLSKGRILYHMGRFKEALIWIDKFLEIDSNELLASVDSQFIPNFHLMFTGLEVSALFFKGSALFYLGNYKDSLDSFETALNLDPTNEIIIEHRINAANALKNEKNGLNDILKDNYKCSVCGFENLEGATFCSGCGQKLEENEKLERKNRIICPDCGFENLEGAVFCDECWSNLENAEIDLIEKPEVIDVNNDSEDKIASLPNIGIVLAKKAIQIRDSQGGFESVEDFCISMELKPHVAKNLENLIICSTIEKPKKTNNSRRVVDF